MEQFLVGFGASGVRFGAAMWGLELLMWGSEVRNVGLALPPSRFITVSLELPKNVTLHFLLLPDLLGLEVKKLKVSSQSDKAFGV